MSRAWMGRLQGVDAPWTDARRARRAQLLGFDHAPIVIATAKGSNLFDLDGNRYADFTASFGAALVGHGHPRVVRTLEMQLERDVRARRRLPDRREIWADRAPRAALPGARARVMFGLSGSDAIDAAIKTALLATGRPGIVAFEGAYHGLGTGPLAACGLRPEFRVPFAPHLTPHVRFLPPRAAPRRSRGRPARGVARGGRRGLRRGRRRRDPGRADPRPRRRAASPKGSSRGCARSRCAAGRCWSPTRLDGPRPLGRDAAQRRGRGGPRFGVPRQGARRRRAD